MPTKKESEETMTPEENEIFSVLWNTDVSAQVEKKNTGKVELSYLSWAWAWKYVRERYPDASYKVIKNEQGLPYFADPVLGIMVYTEVTINNETHEMWLPVMDGANNAMKLEPYEFKTKWGPKSVDAATMFDINKTIMRCLTKNLAMFGLGLRLFAGEDVWGSDERDNEPSQEDLKNIKTRIQNGISKISENMTKEQKDQFVQDVIVKHIGTPDFLACQNYETLKALLDELLSKAKKK